MSRNVRSTLALLLLLFVATGAVHALPAEGREPDRAPGMLAAIWEWAASLLGFESQAHPAREASGPLLPSSGTNGGGSGNCEYGGYIDPNGCTW